MKTAPGNLVSRFPNVRIWSDQLIHFPDLTSDRNRLQTTAINARRLTTRRYRLKTTNLNLFDIFLSKCRLYSADFLFVRLSLEGAARPWILSNNIWQPWFCSEPVEVFDCSNLFGNHCSHFIQIFVFYCSKVLDNHGFVIKGPLGECFMTATIAADSKV